MDMPFAERIGSAEAATEQVEEMRRANHRRDEFHGSTVLNSFYKLTCIIPLITLLVVSFLLEFTWNQSGAAEAN